ncbi:hypothetical protein ABFS82_04G082700 [Erythranthe guttata]|uniref:Uncharacterized protein n=1 Tax=Erythranthe guttata TaxID=4155 RepID=A0A022S101_ERYGU|nr:PREDICTED: protein NUCLEAR FUSION DEFECTIVE 4-like [Erythranthe guttata]EYU45999.1 hypothetical protein MIMGU_mgv1a004386mg [Erythranthe guttata]|eukprot:XP_012839825.1 PREDICTED: protein NUCLEAR FUSION DEFECTIVE 4-like [Erythranthe guttata]
MALQWLTLVATIWLQSINGTNSNFPAYSSELKRTLSITQLQLNNLASASDAGKLLGWISGVAASHFPLWLVLLIGSLLGLVGYGVQFLFLTGQIAPLSYWHVFLLTALAGNSICWINTVCNIVAIRNFSLDRQIAVGLSTSYLGLSAMVYTAVVDVVAGGGGGGGGDSISSSSAERAKLFLFLNAVAPLAVCAAAAPLACMDVGVGKTRNLTTGFFAMFVITTLTGLFAVVTSLGSTAAFSVLFLPGPAVLAGVLAMLALPLVVPVAEMIGERLQRKCRIRVAHGDIEGLAFAAPGTENDVAAAKKEDGEGEIPAKVMVRRVDFWIYFLVYLFGATIGLVYMNNLAQIAESRGFSAGVSSLVSLSSAFSFFGRLLPSLLDYFAPQSKRSISRAAAMGGMMAPMCGAFLLLIINGYGQVSLYISTAIIGISTGAISSISVAATTELFGTNNFGVNHNILISNIPIGSFLFGDFAALLYRARGKGNGEENCMGEKCYQTTFIIWGCLCVFGTFLAFILHKRTRKTCNTFNRL